MTVSETPRVQVQTTTNYYYPGQDAAEDYYYPQQGYVAEQHDNNEPGPSTEQYYAQTYATSAVNYNYGFAEQEEGGHTTSGEHGRKKSKSHSTKKTKERKH
jgi:hypothetical protein